MRALRIASWQCSISTRVVAAEFLVALRAATADALPLDRLGAQGVGLGSELPAVELVDQHWIEAVGELHLRWPAPRSP